MFSVSDMLKILDQVPIWKTLKTLPLRIESLERRVAELEGTKQLPGVTPGQPCPACGHHALRLTSSQRAAGPMGNLGAKDQKWTCGNCGHIEERFAVN